MFRLVWPYVDPIVSWPDTTRHDVMAVLRRRDRQPWDYESHMWKREVVVEKRFFGLEAHGVLVDFMKILK